MFDLWGNVWKYDVTISYDILVISHPQSVARIALTIICIDKEGLLNQVDFPIIKSSDPDKECHSVKLEPDFL